MRHFASRLKKLAILSGYPITWPALLFTRTAAAVEHMDMLRLVRPDTVIDVGANKGQFTLAALAAGARRVISFEPLHNEAAAFERNLGKEKKRVRLHQFALADMCGEAPLYVADRADSSSLLPVGPGQTAAFNVRQAGSMTVKVQRLDGVVATEEIDGTVLLKVDVQGAESQVIRGSTGLLPQIRYIYAEGSFVELYSGQMLASALIRELDAAGFALRGVYNATRSRAYGATQADFLFENVRSAEP